jgi:hypothetical protein
MKKKHKATCTNVTSHIWINGNGAWMGGAWDMGACGLKHSLKPAMFWLLPSHGSKLMPCCPQNSCSIYNIGWVCNQKEKGIKNIYWLQILILCNNVYNSFPTKLALSQHLGFVVLQYMIIHTMWISRLYIPISLS